MQLFALIGEEFEEPLVQGVVVRMHHNEDVLMVCLSDNKAKFRVGYAVCAHKVAP